MEGTTSEVAESIAQVTNDVAGNVTHLYDTAISWVSALGLNLVSAVIVFFIGWFLIKGILSLAHRALERSSLGQELYTFILSVIRITLIVMLAITCAGMLEINVSSFITALGAAGLAVGLALQNSLTNLAGGVFILMTKPFSQGDFVDIGGLTGNVSEIQLVHTILLTADNKKVFIPNGDITSARIINYSAEKTRRLDLIFHIALVEDFVRAEQILMKTILDHPLSLKEPEPLVRVGSYADGTIQIECKVWVDTENYWALYYDLIEQGKKALDEAQIQLPGPANNMNVNVVQVPQAEKAAG